MKTGRLQNRVISLAVVCLFAVTALAGCAAQGGEASQAKPDGGRPSSALSESEPQSFEKEKETVKIAALKGPTGLGMLRLMEQNDAGACKNRYEIVLAGSPDEIVSKITTGEVDVAAVPTNLAATLYNKTGGKVQIAAINTLGVLSVLTNGVNIDGIGDLKGKTVYSSGQGSVPEYAFDYILKQNGLEPGKDVIIEYKAEHTELATLLASGQAEIAVLPEPFVTQVTGKNPDVHVALNLTDEWNRVSDGKSVLTMGCLIVRREFAEQREGVLNAFLSEYKASTEYANKEIEATASLSETYGIMPAAVAQKAIPNCHIVYVEGDELKAKLPEFLQVLFEANPKSVGGKLPGDDFYYSR